MTKAVKIKLTIAILAVLVIIAGLLARGGRPIEITPQDRQLQKKLEQKTQPSAHPYVVP